LALGFYYGGILHGKEMFEQLEVRAFGFLLGELLERQQDEVTGEEEEEHAKQQQLVEKGELQIPTMTRESIHNVRTAANLCAGELGARPAFANLVELLST
jgi:hypothetical protein